MVLAAIMLARRQRLLPARGERTRLAIICFLHDLRSASGSAHSDWVYVGAGRAAVLMYTMQLWVLPLGWMLAGERITPIAMIGALGIFSGLVPSHEPRAGELARFQGFVWKCTAADLRIMLGAGGVPLPPLPMADALLDAGFLADLVVRHCHRNGRAGSRPAPSGHLEWRRQLAYSYTTGCVLRRCAMRYGAKC